MSSLWCSFAAGKREGKSGVAHGPAVALAALLAGLALAAAPAAAVAASGSWQPIGPSGGVGGRLTIDPANSDTVFAAAGAGGLFKTTNGGSHWARSDAGMLPNSFYQVVFDPVVTSTVYAATARGLWKSVDGGASWSGPASGLGAFIGFLLIDPRTPSTLYAANSSRVWKSVDGGASWFDSGKGLNVRRSLVLTLAIDPRRPATLYAGTTFGMWRSLDSGASWQPARTGMGTPDVLALAVDPLVRGTVYAGVQQNQMSTNEGLFVSTDGGASWSARRISTTPAAGGISCLAVSPAAPRTFYACSLSAAGLLQSTNGGRSWAPINAGISFVGSVAIDPTLPDRLYAAANEFLNAGPAVSKSSNGGAAWTLSDDGIETLAVAALAVDAARPGTVYAGTIGAGIYATADDGAHWAPADTGLRGGNMVSFLAVDPVLPSTLYCHTERGFFASNDGAAHWFRPGARFTGLPLVVDPQVPATLYSVRPGGTEAALVKTVDGGASWTPTGGSVFRAVYLLTIAPSDAATLYLTVPFEGPRVQGVSLGVSNDGGATAAELPTPFRDVTILAVDPTTPTTLVLAANDFTGDGLWRSTDGGRTFARLPGIGTVFALLLDPAAPSVIYAGTPTDVMVSGDGGASWSELAPGLPGSGVVQLAFGAGGALYAGTQGASVWRLAP
jgi:photosystem II stability/assembly factor-like uncharacterized protein